MILGEMISCPRQLHVPSFSQMEEEQGQAMPTTTALQGFFSTTLSLSLQACHIVVDNARSGETAHGRKLKQQRADDKSSSSTRWSDTCSNSSTESPSMLARRSRRRFSDSPSENEPAAYLQLQKLQNQVKRCWQHSADAVDLLPAYVARSAQQIKKKVYSTPDGDAPSDQAHDTDHELATSTESERDNDLESSECGLMPDAPGTTIGLLGSPSTSSKADIDLGKLLIKTIKRLSLKAALELSRPRANDMKVIHEQMENLPSSGAVTDIRTQRRTKRMAKIHHKEKFRTEVEINHAMCIAAVDRLSVRAALTLTSALDFWEVADGESSPFYDS